MARRARPQRAVGCSPPRYSRWSSSDALGNQLSAAGFGWAAYLLDMGNDPARDNTQVLLPGRIRLAAAALASS